MKSLIIGANGGVGQHLVRKRKQEMLILLPVLGKKNKLKL